VKAQKIITIKGTSGSGKSTLVRKVMGLYRGQKEIFKAPKRRQPLGYVLHRDESVEPEMNWNNALALIGHYETACGGCDTINTYDKVFELIEEAYGWGHDVLYEGLLLSGDFRRTLALHEAHPGELLVIHLNTPLQDCIDSVNARRRAKNPDAEDANPNNTISKFKAINSTMDKLQGAGVRTESCSRDEAYELIKKELELWEA